MSFHQQPFRVQVRERHSKYSYHTVHTERSKEDAVWAAQQYLSLDAVYNVRVLDDRNAVVWQARAKRGVQ